MARMDITTVSHVDLQRYMGSWYVIAVIPSPLEKNVYDAVESYRLATDGTIETTFTYRKGSFDGDLKTLRARGFIKDAPANAVWGMQLFWPIKADYRISWLADDYSQVVVAREKRDYVWIMARTPQISDSDLNERITFVAHLGYDTALIRRVPQNESAAGN